MAISLTQVTDYLLAQSWQIAVLVLVIAVISYTLRNKSAHIRYLLWLIVLAKCFVPPFYDIPLAILPAQDRTEPATISTPFEVVLPESEIANTMVSESSGLSSAPFDTPPVAAVEAKHPRLKISQQLGIGWLIGACTLIIFNLIRALRANIWLWRYRKTLPIELRRNIEKSFFASGVKNFPSVWLIEGFNQPFVWGLLRGSIYLPVNFLNINKQEHQKSVLGHEISHVLRFDAAVNILQVIAQALFWFHPLVWWANRKIRQEREKCCDEMAIALLSDLPGDYGNAILETLAARDESIRPVPSLAVAGLVKNVEERIKTIMKAKKRFYKRPSVITAAAVLLMAILIVPTSLVLTARAATESVTESQFEAMDSLHQAAIDGDIDKVKSLIAKGVDVNAKSGYGNWTPLHVAARYGHRHVSEVLLNNGAEVDAEARRQVTPLFYAVSHGHKNVAELFIEKGANVNVKIQLSQATPLYCASMDPHEELVDLLLTKGADVDAALFCAARTGHIVATKLLLTKGANVNAKGENGLTPLHEAATYCRRSVAELLISHGADVNAKDDSGMTPAYAVIGMSMFYDQEQVVQMVNLLLGKGTKTDLHLAAFAGDLNKVRDFLEKDVDVDATVEVGTGRQKNMLTPLCLAIIGGQKDVVRFLIAQGADVNANAGSDSGPLHFAVMYPDYELVKLLIDRGADVTAKSQSPLSMPPVLMPLWATGFSNLPLFEWGTPPDIDFQSSNPAVDSWEEKSDNSFLATWPKVRSVIELLLAGGADVNSKGPGERTLLIEAASAGLKDAVELLLDNGANMHARDSSGWTALHYACWKNHREVAEFLIDKGAVVNAREKEGKTPMAVAKKEGHNEIVELLNKHGAKE